jgi:hypothetical protein
MNKIGELGFIRELVIILIINQVPRTVQNANHWLNVETN